MCFLFERDSIATTSDTCYGRCNFAPSLQAALPNESVCPQNYLNAGSATTTLLSSHGNSVTVIHGMLVLHAVQMLVDLNCNLLSHAGSTAVIVVSIPSSLFSATYHFLIFVSFIRYPERVYIRCVTMGETWILADILTFVYRSVSSGLGAAVFWQAFLEDEGRTDRGSGAFIVPRHRRNRSFLTL
jgi:hypothetical protein